jgi:hypothetical protein
MTSAARLLPVARALATIASILGMLVLTMVIVGTLSLGAPIFAGQWRRDAVLLGLIALPLAQLALVIGAGMKEKMYPALSTRLYALAVLMLAIVVAIPALV